MRRKAIGWIVLIFMIVLATACSSSPQAPETGSTAGAQKGEQATGEPADQKQAAQKESVFPRQVESAGGKITIQKQPQKVALASWQLVEMVLPFDQPSVGVTLPFSAANSVLESEQLKPYVGKFKEFKIVGEGTQVNLEALLSYGPDLIIAGSKTNQSIKEQLEKVAQTVWIDEEAINMRTEWLRVVGMIGNVLGQEKRAEEVIAKFTETQKAGKQKLAAKQGESVLFVQVREKAVYVMQPSTLPAYYDGLGLTFPKMSENMPANGQLTLEGLSVINPDHLVLGYFNYTNKSLPALTDEWEKSEVWKSLKAVKQNQVYAINGELAMGLGPIGQQYGLETLIKAMGK
ncbi:ABC transporter substrate-binding protein [Paenibacillus hodogayensis]|uniref:ABC transporter substrate-binding protein n=1 Tax=Paenibacillus hodogayensis TaxID=279208 RepID=A0ABV5W190_9BACL